MTNDLFRPSPFVLRPYFPLHVGAARLAAEASRVNEHAQRAAALGRQLQAAEIADVEHPARGIDRTDTGASQRLVEGPQLGRLIRRLEKERLRQIDAPGRGGWCIERAAAIDDDERPAAGTCLPSSSQSQRARAAARSGREIFHKRTTRESSDRQQPIQSRRTSRNRPLINRPAGLFEPGQSLAKVGDEGVGGGSTGGDHGLKHPHRGVRH